MVVLQSWTSAASRALSIPRAPPELGVLLEEDTIHNEESWWNKIHKWKKEEQLRNPSTYRGFQEPRNGRLAGGVEPPGIAALLAPTVGAGEESESADPSADFPDAFGSTALRSAT
jgi:hypothetical protein